jgi:hypothetical protein
MDPVKEVDHLNDYMFGDRKHTKFTADVPSERRQSETKSPFIRNILFLSFKNNLKHTLILILGSGI